MKQNASLFRRYQGNTLILWGGKDKILTSQQIPFLTDKLRIPEKRRYLPHGAWTSLLHRRIPDGFSKLNIPMKDYRVLGKKEPDFVVRRNRAYNWRRPTLTGPIAPLPSALQRFTSGFGMGPGGSTALWPPEKSFSVCSFSVCQFRGWRAGHKLKGFSLRVRLLMESCLLIACLSRVVCLVFSLKHS